MAEQLPTCDGTGWVTEEDGGGWSHTYLHEPCDACREARASESPVTAVEELLRPDVLESLLEACDRLWSLRNTAKQRTTTPVYTGHQLDLIIEHLPALIQVAAEAWAADAAVGEEDGLLVGIRLRTSAHRLLASTTEL